MQHRWHDRPRPSWRPAQAVTKSIASSNEVREFAALHESANGPSRQFAARRNGVAFGVMRTCPGPCGMSANDPERSSPIATERQGFGGYDDLPRLDPLLSIVRTDHAKRSLGSKCRSCGVSHIFSLADVFLQRFGGITSKPYGQQDSFDATKYPVADFCRVSDRFFRPVKQLMVRYLDVSFGRKFNSPLLFEYSGEKGCRIS
jgi:hypothetical protein